MAQPWSLFNPAVHDAHYAALRRTLLQSQTLAQAHSAPGDSVGAAKPAEDSR
jgi:hypothetical protein